MDGYRSIQSVKLNGQAPISVEALTWMSKLPIEQQHEYIMGTWGPRCEKLFTGTMNVNDITPIYDEEWFTKHITAYMDTESFDINPYDEYGPVFNPESENADANGHCGDVIDKWFMGDLIQFIRCIWLTHEFLRDGQFNNRLCVHYNPTHDTNYSHPGTMRHAIAHMFQTPDNQEADVFYFNTGGFFDKSFMSDFEIVNMSKTFKEWNTYMMGIVPDHCTFIPQIVNDVEAPWVGGELWQLRMNKFSKHGGFKVWSNRDLLLHDKFKTDAMDQASIEVDFLEYPHGLEIIRGTLLALAQQEWESSTLKVTVKRTI